MDQKACRCHFFVTNRHHESTQGKHFLISTFSTRTNSGRLWSRGRGPGAGGPTAGKPATRCPIGPVITGPMFHWAGGRNAEEGGRPAGSGGHVAPDVLDAGGE